jgi:peptidyl-prolyl cis-trans isomerase A (cyclophilin A)
VIKAINISSIILILTLYCLMISACTATNPQKLPVAVLTTQYGDIRIRLNTIKAPVGAQNFINYIKGGYYQNLTFYRTVNHNNDNHPLKIGVLQGGINANFNPAFVSAFKSIQHESTTQTNLHHTRGTISYARGELGSANTEFFISTLDNPHLDAGGLRHPDKQGFSVFGEVITGMDVIDKIAALPANQTHSDPYVKGQILNHAVKISNIIIEK